ncbi:putative membrane protein [Rickettsia rhipicephali str. Ect]|uniref:Putative membrane protein n=1 Tax=Rickettsia rhipicephali str. Ect TaxID=1359199 RepID=A0A0F3PDU9_RICRH|nr:putative membrane protein [Rickettsia rhipicephali str. Ect]
MIWYIAIPLFINLHVYLYMVLSWAIIGYNIRKLNKNAIILENN